MSKTDANGLPVHTRPEGFAARRRYGKEIAWLAALLVTIPAAACMAQEKGAAPPVQAAAAQTMPAQAAPTPKPDVAPVEKPQPSQPMAVQPPADVVIVRTDVYGSMISRVGKVATFLSLVSTSSEPLPAGAKGLLFRKVEKPGDLAGTTWVQMGEVTVKKLDAGGKMQLSIDSEPAAEPVVKGKKVVNHFSKGTKIKLQVDRLGS